MVSGLEICEDRRTGHGGNIFAASHDLKPQKLDRLDFAVQLVI